MRSKVFARKVNRKLGVFIFFLWLAKLSCQLIRQRLNVRDFNANRQNESGCSAGESSNHGKPLIIGNDWLLHSLSWQTLKWVRTYVIVCVCGLQPQKREKEKTTEKFYSNDSNGDGKRKWQMSAINWQ